MTHAERALRREEPIEVQRARVRTVSSQMVDGFTFEHQIMGEGANAYVAWRVYSVSVVRGMLMLGYVRRSLGNSQRWTGSSPQGESAGPFRTRTEAAEWLVEHYRALPPS